MHAPLRITAAMTALIATTLLIITPVGAHPQEETHTLQQALEEASRRYVDAQAKLEATRKHRDELAAEITTKQDEIAELSTAVKHLASTAYKNGAMTSTQVLLHSNTPHSLLSSATTMRYMAQRDNAKLAALKTAQEQLSRQHQELEATLVVQEKHLKELAQRKADALTALKKAGGGDPALGFGPATTTAQPAPRRPDGSWPSESCSVKDPTTSGCLTPRTLHALQQAQEAGFTRYVSCYRSLEDGGEHPRGRACDFAAAPKGFGGAATGDDREYGNRLAAWFIANADRLGVLYVIWYRQIWMPGIGWRSYFGSGSPSAEHTNHVHLSIR